jgi:hypothetical protein
MSELFDLNSSKEKVKPSSKSSSRSKTFSKLKLIDSDQEMSLSNLDLNVLANSEKIINQDQDAQIDLNSAKSSIKESSDYTSVVKKHKSKKRKTKEVSIENNVESIRRDKNDLLFKINKLNINGRYSLINLTMNDSLDDIRNEYERIQKGIELSTSVKFYKTALIMGTRGLEMLNSQYDPLGIDLEGFSNSLAINVDEQSYEEVLIELAEKYKSMGNVSPELKLVGLLAMSGFSFVATKRMQKTRNEQLNFQRETRDRYRAHVDSDTESDDSSAKMPVPEQTFNSATTKIDLDVDDTEIKESDLEAALDKMHQNAVVEQEKIIEIVPKRKGRPPKIKS